MRPLHKSLGQVVASLITAVLVLGGVAWRSAQAQQPRSAAAAVKEVAERTGVPISSLQVLRAASLGPGGIARFKILNTQDGTIYGADLDLQGNSVSEETVMQAVAAAPRQSFRGKLEAELADRIDRSDEDETFRVGVWVKSHPMRGPADRPTTTEQAIALRAIITDEVTDFLSPIREYLRTAAIPVIYQSQYAPLIFVEASTPQIRALASQDDVEVIFRERVHQPRLDISKQVVRADIVNAAGIQGQGVLAGVLEAGHPQLDNPFLGGVIRCLPENPTTVNAHQTQVAGVIRSLHPTFTGIAPAATLISGNAVDFSDPQLIAANDCLINQMVPTINMSFGVETQGFFDAFARYVDNTVYNTGTSVNVAVSNVCAFRIGSPEIAFNVNAVGGFGDMNTVDFGDDVHGCETPDNFSAFMDPFSPHNDREEPDVVAPGDLIITTTPSGITPEPGVVGTSFAAPHVTGTTALLMQRKPALEAQAEEVRAILMASAWHNIEGDPRLSERDGAGAILASKADEVLVNGESSFFIRPGGTAGFPIETPVFAFAGEQIRIAIAWSHKAGDMGTQPSTDLDLLVFAPEGKLVAISASFDNSYEIVLVTAPVDGTYTVQITNFRPSPGAEFIGQAISRGATEP
jgi:subtilisin family serine protease